MMNLLDWLWAVPGHRVVSLFDATNDLVVRTKESGPEKRRLLCRSAEMEAAVIDLVEAGLQQEGWEGLLYIMGWGDKSDFRPLYAGKAERKGVRNELFLLPMGLSRGKSVSCLAGSAKPSRVARPKAVGLARTND